MQQRTVAAYALMLGLTVDRMFVERGASGSVRLSERAEGSALPAVLKAGDVVITRKLDRMFRSALDALDVLAKLKARNVSLPVQRALRANRLDTQTECSRRFGHRSKNQSFQWPVLHYCADCVINS